MSKLSIKDMAKALNTSTAAISYVLNGKAREMRISDSLAKKILKFAKANNYSPSRLSVSLRTGRTGIICLMIEDIADNFFATIAGRIAELARPLGIKVVYMSTENDTEKTRELIADFRRQNVDGFIITPPPGIEKDIKALIEDEIPVVLFDRGLKNVSTGYVGVDNLESSENAVMHLHEHGYRHIAFVTLNSTLPQMADRLHGYKRAAQRIKMPVLVKKLEYEERDTPQAIEKIVRFLRQEPAIDAVFFATGSLAITGLEAFQQLSLKIGRDIGMVAFDDNNFLRAHSPSITAIAQPVAELGEALVTMINTLITGKKKTKTKSDKVILPTKLVVRQSSMPLLILFLFFFGLTTRVFAEQLPHTPAVFIDIRQGLSNNTVRCILKDHRGFLWFGTRDGLNRYDGNTFTVYRHQFKDTNSVISDYILSLYEDSANRLWIGTRQGISIYDPLAGRFATLSWISPKDHQIRRIEGVIKEFGNDGRGNILIGTEDLGLLIYRPGTAAATPVALMEGHTATFQYGVHAIKTAGSRIWVQVQKKGLCLLDPSTGQLTLVNTELPLAGSLEITNGTLWTGSGNSLYQYEPVSNTYTRAWQFSSDGHSPDEIWTIKKDGGNSLLLGTVNGHVLTWDIATHRLLPEPLADTIGIIQYGTIYDLYVDAENKKWIATAKGGIGVIDPQRARFHSFTQLTGTLGSSAGFVTSFAEPANGDLYIGTEGNGMLVYNRRTEQVTPLETHIRKGNYLAGGKVINMCIDKAGRIWTAEQSAGIDRIDPTSGQIVHYYCNKTAGGSESNWVWMIYTDSHNDCWATTLRQVSLMGALYRFDPVANRFVVFDTSLSDLFTLYEDRQGTLWGGTLNRLIAIDKVERHHRWYPIDFSVRCIFEDKAGHLWLGTEGGGLLCFDRKRGVVVSRYTTDDGLCNNTINAILEDGAGTLWLSTANGLSRFDPGMHRFRNYFDADGLQSNEFIYNSALILRSGEFAFGGIKGFNLFDPLTIHETNDKPKLLLTGITVNGTPLEKAPALVSKWGADQVEEIRVPYNQAFFSFDFTALEFSAPQEIDYAYFMDGWDRQWTDAGHQRKAAYTHLEEGHYIFRVKSTNTAGKWNPAEIRLAITVLPPWYRTGWAYAFYILVVGGLLALYRNYKARQSRLKYEIAIAKLNAEKERSEHERKLSFFTNISHEFRTPLTLIINPVKDLLKKAARDFDSNGEAALEQAELNVIHRNARRMLSLVDQLLLFRKADSGADRLLPSRLNMIDLGREVYLSFTQQARVKDIRYEFNSDKEIQEIYADREKVEIILFNLVSNALKYTPTGGAVSLSIAGTHDFIEVRVSDTGPGIPAGAGDHIFERFYQADNSTTRPKPGFGIGLYLARQFAVAHEGQLSYTSEENKGSVFLLRLPRRAAHPNDLPLPEDREPSELFQELVTDDITDETVGQGNQLSETITPLVDEKRSILIIDDDQAMRNYVVSIFRENMTIYQAADGTEGLRLALEHLPDIIVSDIRMQGISGIDVCRTLKANPASSHIPIVLLTGTLAPDLELQGVEGGADLYLTKPFNKELLQAKVANLLQSRTNFRTALFNEITHNDSPRKISAADKEFLDKCVSIIEKHLDEEDFAVKDLATQMGISHSSLYKRVKTLYGQSLNAFIRQVRLRNAAILCINSEYNVNEIASRVGIIDRTHFREQFQKVYGMTAAEYIRKYRKPLSSQYSIKKNK